jgi:hypothetical protein
VPGNAQLVGTITLPAGLFATAKRATRPGQNPPTVFDKVEVNHQLLFVVLHKRVDNMGGQAVAVAVAG